MTLFAEFKSFIFILVPPLVFGVTPVSVTTTSQQVQDITISWMVCACGNYCKSFDDYKT